MDEFTHIFRIQPRIELRRSYQVAAQYSELASVGFRGSCVELSGGSRRRIAQFSDGFKELAAMSNKGNSEVPQIVAREPRQDRTVDRVIVEV
jgi:hypothetical protein